MNSNAQISVTNSTLSCRVAELAERLQAGEQIDLKAFCSDCPDQFEQLEMLLPTLQAVVDLENSLTADSDSPPPVTGEGLAEGATAAGLLGDFRILREIGRGGMGVVYEAEQISLGRRVALKVLPFAAMLDRQQLARFKNEARAAATLDHPNIVAIYSVGAERGVHYYAMQLIEGQSLAQVVEQLRAGSHPQAGTRQGAGTEEKVCSPSLHGEGLGEGSSDTAANAHLPTLRVEDSPWRAPSSSLPAFSSREYFRTIAQLGIQAAEALDHAHQNGVLHRDIKPANLLVDDTGKLWITDFGLARMEQDAGMTMTGDVLGTLRYMSPEQALAKRVVVDHRSDIYSLGVTLYELLILQPAYRATDRQELLRQIAFDEPRKPRQINPRIAKDLETIILKSIEKEPADRYTTAQDLADDLRRFLEDQPIAAKPPNLLARSRKWSRRNRPAMWAAVVTLLVSLIVVAGSIGWLAREQAVRHARLTAQIGVILADADRLMAEQNWPEALAAAKRAEVALAAGGADKSMRHQVGYVLKDLEFLDRLEQIRMQQAAWVGRAFDYASAVRQYPRAFRDYGVDVEELAVETSIDRLKARPALAIPLAAALDEWVNARRAISEKDAAGWKRLVAIARGIDPDPLRDRLRSTWGQPVSPKVQDELRRLAESIDIRAQHPATLVSLARTLQRVEDWDSALRLLRDARYVYPGDYWLNFEVGFALDRQEDHEGAIRFYTAAASIRPNSAAAHNNLGNALRVQKKLDEAIAVYRKAIELDPKLVYAHANLGIAVHEQKNDDEAIAACRKAIELDPTYASAHSILGNVLRGQGKIDEAMAAYRKAIEVEPDFAEAHNNLGIALHEQKKDDEAIACFEKAIKLSPKFAIAYGGLGDAVYAQGRLADAIDAWRNAIELDPKYVGAHYNLAVALTDQKKFDEAIPYYHKAIALDPNHVRAHSGLGLALCHKGLFDEAIAEFGEAVRVKPDYAEAWYYRGNAHKDLRQYDKAIAALSKAIDLKPDYAEAWCNRGVIHQELQQYDEAIAQYRKAIEIEPKYANAHGQLGNALLEKNEMDQAIACYRKVIELNPKDSTAYHNLGVALSLQGKLDEAIAAFGKAIEVNPNSHNHFTAGSAYARLGRWNEAIGAFNRGLELDSTNHWFWFQSAALMLYTGDDEAYRRACQEMLLRFSETDNPNIAERVAKTCLLLPDAVSDLELVQRLAERAVSGTEGRDGYSWFAMCKGLAEYRAGKPASAIDWLQPVSRNTADRHRDATVSALLAMAHYSLGQNAEAKAALDEAKAIIDANMPNPDRGQPFGDDWHDWLHARIFLREAEALLNAKDEKGTTKEPH